MSDAPIGIFDSGVGGLTVARAVATLLPRESIIYIGDTAHTPTATSPSRMSGATRWRSSTTSWSAA
ncbi:Glutamate racemase 1 [Clavibacter michiganensis subsp. michiganensis]|uniref:Glutamate racemase 1 n=1 Tax=Clavibacter michiganensis subsp. michiganensis TaxID=33013 RepID=A0A251XFR2_CLAMM|nr:Glutamate racemase 1 [Clavibacter michiganensis subsp. michiganensis]OUE01388.1 Glutamate racemase 1 [Clavibacter michiganensis subsp. michiganensis]